MKVVVTRFSFACLAILSTFYSAVVHTADVYVHVFFQETAVQRVEITLDEEYVGETDKRGSYEFYVGDGDHTLGLSHNGILIREIEFSADDGDEIEIKVSFDRNSGNTDVDVQSFPRGAKSNATGFLTGIVRSSDGDVLQGAVLNVPGADLSTVSDAQGAYVLELRRGAYRIEVTHPDYQPSELQSMRVFAGIGVQAMITLYRDELGISRPDIGLPDLEEVVILGTFNPNQSAVDLERFATTVTDALDITQLERFGDSDVAAALGRIVGVSVADDKYANVRGLDGRYISSSLNGLLMPSTDPLRRDVQLDLFPSNILGGIEIQKTYTADQLGSTTGGSVKMTTRGLPDERVFKLSASSSYRQNVTGDRVASYRSSRTDGLGFDSDLRALSQDVLTATNGGRDLTICDPELDPRCTSPIQAAALALTFEDDYNVSRKRANPDVSASVSYGDRIELESMDFAYYAAASYSHSTGDRGIAVLDDPLDEVGTYVRAKENTGVNAYLVTGFEFREADEILSKTMLLRNTDDVTRQDDVIDLEDVAIQSVILEFVERQFFSQQLSGKHDIVLLDDVSKLEWRLGYSQSRRDEPDRRQYQYRSSTFSPSGLERRWSELEEESIDIGFDYRLPLTVSEQVSLDLKLGGLWSERTRDVSLYRFGVRPGSTNSAIDTGIDQNLEDVLSYVNFVRDRWRLNTLTTDTDSYTSDEELQALYVAGTFELGSQWTLDAGIRWEDFSQELRYPNEPVSSNSLQSDELLPALNATFRINDRWQLRAGFSQTVSYPGLIERAQSLVFDPATDDPIFGNPELRVSNIDNFDLRGEYYFSDEESISLAVFFKDISDPVERQVPDASGSAAAGITFRNAQKAELLGVEIDAYKNVLDMESSLLFVAGNLSWIDSKVSLDDDSLRLEGAAAQGRELQGQSPWLANLQVGYDHFETAQKVTLLVNYFDDRIFRIARGANRQPEIEKGRVLVDFSYEKLIGESLSIRAQVKNLFNEKVEFEQNNRIIESYDEGTSLSLKIEYEFL